MSVMQQAHKMHSPREDCFCGLKSKQKRTYANMHKIFRRARKRERRPSAARPPTRWCSFLYKPREIPLSLSLSLFKAALHAMRSIIHATLRQHLLNKHSHNILLARGKNNANARGALCIRKCALRTHWS
jgi:hypothetical protein